MADVDLRMSGAPFSLSFSGGGFLAIYEIGVIQGLLEQAPGILRSAPKVYGASSGSIIAAAVVCGLSLDDLKRCLYGAARDARRNFLGPLAPGCSVLRMLQQRLYQILPENSHRMATGRLYVSLTRLVDGQNVVVSEYNSKEELIQALICSCFVPIYTGFIPPSFRGVRYVDGGFTNLQPHSDMETAITVSPFTGEIDICPRDCPAIFYSLHIVHGSIQISIENLCRIGYALFPPSCRAIGAVTQLEHQKKVELVSGAQAEPGILDREQGGYLDNKGSGIWENVVSPIGTEEAGFCKYYLSIICYTNSLRPFLVSSMSLFQPYLEMPKTAPSPCKVLNEFYSQGYQDAILFLHRNNIFETGYLSKTVTFEFVGVFSKKDLFHADERASCQAAGMGILKTSNRTTSKRTSEGFSRNPHKAGNKLLQQLPSQCRKASAVLHMEERPGLLSSITGFILSMKPPTSVAWSFCKRLEQLWHFWKRSGGLEENSKGPQRAVLSDTAGAKC